LQKQTALDRQQLEVLQNQQTSGIPDTPDVPRLRLKRNKIYTFEDTQDLGIVATSATLEVDTSYSFNLNSAGNASAFTSLFDTWRIAQITIKFVPQFFSGATQIPPVLTVIDYDDTTTTPISALINYDTLKISPGNAYFERTFAPKLALSNYTGAFGGFSQASTWVDCNSSTTLWYGLKLGISSPGVAFQLYHVYADVIFQFKNTR
jgi:hypothetical protein